MCMHKAPLLRAVQLAKIRLCIHRIIYYIHEYIYIYICGVCLLVGVSPRESAKFRLNPSSMCSDMPSESSKSVCSCFISVHAKAPDCLKTLVWSYTYLILFVSKSEGSRNSMVRSKQVVLASCAGSPVNMSLKASLTAYLRWTHGTSSDSRTSEPSVRRRFKWRMEQMQHALELLDLFPANLYSLPLSA